MSEPAVRLVEITAESVCAVIDLEVAPGQQDFVAPNAVSIAEAHFKRGAWFRAIEVDGAPVGFVMLFDPTLPGATLRKSGRPDEVLLWRLMIDRRHQRAGIGRKALDLVVDHARTRPGIARVVSSYVPGDGGPRDFYLGYGFAETGEMAADGAEVVISYPL